MRPDDREELPTESTFACTNLTANTSYLLPCTARNMNIATCTRNSANDAVGVYRGMMVAPVCLRRASPKAMQSWVVAAAASSTPAKKSADPCGVERVGLFLGCGISHTQMWLIPYSPYIPEGTSATVTAQALGQTSAPRCGKSHTRIW